MESQSITIVTGASGGIGRAIATRLAASHTPMCLLARSETKLDEVVRAVSRPGYSPISFAADFSAIESVAAVAKRILALNIPVSTLIHACGAMHHAPFRDSTIEDFELIMRINVLAPFLLTRDLLPAICAERGHVLFINSSIVAHPSPNTAIYASAKHALLGIANSLRAEVNASGVRVTTIFPGRVATAMQETVMKSEGRPFDPTRLVQPEDIAETVFHVLFLPKTAEVTDVFVRSTVKP